MNKFKNQQAVILYLAVVITAIMLAIALGVSTILFGQIRTIKEMGYSVNALYAADTGIEKMLYDFKNDPSIVDNCPLTDSIKDSPCQDSLSNGANYYLAILASGVGGCPADNFCARSFGEYQGVRRAIEIGF